MSCGLSSEARPVRLANSRTGKSCAETRSPAIPAATARPTSLRPSAAESERPFRHARQDPQSGQGPAGRDDGRDKGRPGEGEGRRLRPPRPDDRQIPSEGQCDAEPYPDRSDNPERTEECPPDRPRRGLPLGAPQDRAHIPPRRARPGTPIGARLLGLASQARRRGPRSPTDVPDGARPRSPPEPTAARPPRRGR